MPQFTPSLMFHLAHCGQIGSSVEEIAQGLEGFCFNSGDLLVRFPPKQDVVLYQAHAFDAWLRSLGYQAYEKKSQRVVLGEAAKLIWEKACRLPPALAQREAWEIARAMRVRKISAPKARARRI